MDQIKICVGYSVKGERVDDFPIDDIEHATPIYESMPGWKADLASARSLEALPEAARRYVARIEMEAGCPVVLVSVGSRRDETIALLDPFRS